MFGYIAIHKPELKVREYEAYQACYCGLCRSLKRRHGRLGQLTLSYDMVFLALLLTGLYEPETRTGSLRCPAHPLHRRPYRENPYFDYAADMNVILTYYKCLDDWEDDRRFSGLLYARLLKGRMKKLKRQYGTKVSKTGRLLLKLRECERKKRYGIDRTAGLFGAIMAELFVYREDEWTQGLQRMGFFFGKFLYLMDAYVDVEEDRKRGRYNPFDGLYGQADFEEKSGMILKMMIAEASRSFEALPILEDAGILRNILYAGVWTRYGQVRQKRKETEKSHDKRSI